MTNVTNSGQLTYERGPRKFYSTHGMMTGRQMPKLGKFFIPHLPHNWTFPKSQRDDAERPPHPERIFEDVRRRADIWENSGKARKSTVLFRVTIN